MSEMSASVAGVGSSMSVASTGARVSAAVSTSTVNGTANPASAASGIRLNPAEGGGAAVEGSSATTRLSSTTQSLYYAQSSTSSGGTALSVNERMAALVLALVAAVLGLKDKDEEDKKLLAGLVGMMAQAGGGRSYSSQYQSLELSQSSQVVQTTTTSNTSAVQAASYDRSGSGVAQSGTQTGGTLNIVA